jgi:hypothetical protein
MHSPLPKTNAVVLEAARRALPYLLSWGLLVVLMIVGMERMPSALYRPIDGEWAKWNVEAILHFGKVLDLSPYSMLAGMGSMYFPNLPWLNPGALALGLPLADPSKNIASYIVYAAELAVSIVALARVIGFSWPMSTVAAQLYLYLLFPPFSEVFRIYDWYALAPYYAHLQATLNGATALLLVCGRLGAWWRNAILAIGVFVLFVSGLLSAPFTFVFATPAYVAVAATLILTRRRALAEWAWKIAALALCLMFFFSSGLLDYYLGTVATAGRTPTATVAWDRLLSAASWLHLFRDHSICSDPRLLLCVQNRGAWLQIAALCGAAIAIVMHRGQLRAAAAALIGYIGLVHVHAYAYQTISLGPAGVLSSHFLMLSAWSFICMFAVVPFFQPFDLFSRNASADAKPSHREHVIRFFADFAFGLLLLVTVIVILQNPYGSERYRPAQLAVFAAAVGVLVALITLVKVYRSRRFAISLSEAPGTGWRRAALLWAFPVLALVHLSMGMREPTPPARDPAVRDYLHEHAAIEIGKPFRGFAATIWLATRRTSDDNPKDVEYSLNRFDDTVYLWRSNVPTLEEYGEWTSAQAHAFVRRLLAPAGMRIHTNYLRAFAIEPNILRALGVRFILTNTETIDDPGVVPLDVKASDAPEEYLFELRGANLGTYSPTRFAKAATADEIANWLRENQGRLDQMAVVSDEVPPASAQARNVEMTVERDGVRIRATSDGPAYILLPVQFSHCLRVVNAAPVRLIRANLMQTLISFDRTLDARLEFRFGLFADNTCRLRDGLDNKALALQ